MTYNMDELSIAIDTLPKASAAVAIFELARERGYEDYGMLEQAKSVKDKLMSPERTQGLGHERRIVKKSTMLSPSI